MSCAPVADNETVEAPLAAKDVGQCVMVGGSGNSVEVLKGRHESACSSINGGAKWRQVNLAQQLLGNVHGVVVAPTLNRTVRNVVLGTSDNTRGIGHIFTLKAAHLCGGNL